MKKNIVLYVVAFLAITFAVLSCKKILNNCSSESSLLKNRISKSWKLHQVQSNNCIDAVANNAWNLELSRSGDCYSITNNVFGEKEAQIGKWDIVNAGTTLQINNYILTSKPVFISTWYKILKLSENELWLESSFNDNEVFLFISIQK